MSVNHVDEFEKAVGRFINNLKINISSAVDNLPKNLKKTDKATRKEFAKAQIEVLSYLNKNLAGIKEKREYMR